MKIKDFFVNIKIPDATWSKLLDKAIRNFSSKLEQSFFPLVIQPKYVVGDYRNYTMSNPVPPKPQKQILPASPYPYLDKRGKHLQVGDIVSFVKGVKHHGSSTPDFGKIVSITNYQDFNWNYQQSNWQPYTYTEMLFEGHRVKRAPCEVVKLDQ